MATVQAPSVEDPLVRRLSESIGGPLGSRAGRHRWWTPLRVILVLTALTFAVGMWQKGNCYDASWTNGESRYTHMCYSDLPYLYTGRGMAELEWPYSEDTETRRRYPEVMEYPVGISYWAWGTAYVTHWVTGAPDLAQRAAVPVDSFWGDKQIVKEVRVYVVVNAIGFALVTLLAAGLLTRVNPGRPWDAAPFALAPTLALSGLVNWDLVAVLFVAGALWAWTRGSPTWTGIMIGLGVATKLYPLFLLGGLLIICLRSKRLADFFNVVSTSIITWVLVNAPALLTGPAQWKHFWEFNSSRGADLGSIWLVLSQAMDKTFTPETINRGSWIFFIAWCVVVLIVGLRAPVNPRFAQLGFLIVVGFLLVNKVYSPQYVLWLLPLAVMARPRWRDLLIWQVGETLYFASVWWYLGGFLAPGSSDGDAVTYWIAIVLRMAAELYLCAMVVRDMYHPEQDPVRAAVVEEGAARPPVVEEGAARPPVVEEPRSPSSGG